MNNITRYILLTLGLLAIAFFLWYFSNIVIYIIVSAVLTLIGRPLVKLTGKIKAGRFNIPVALRALITLLVLWFLTIGFFRVFIPIIANEASELSNVDVNSFVDRIEEPLGSIEKFYQYLNLGGENDMSLEEYVEKKLASVFQISILSGFFSYLTTLLGNIFIAVFSISFITFFLLKEENLLTEMMVILIPDKYEDNFRTALASVKHLLTRYLIGILIQLTGILSLVTIGMFIVGLSFKQSLLIGLTAALLNVIPYLGPLIGSTLGILMGMAFNINIELHDLLIMGGSMLVVFLIVQAIDNVIIQPFVFSGSVKAHPLEIFLVIMMAGSLAGVPGMILAIPAYTIIRVFAKVFFSNFKIVKKLTQKI